MKLLRYLLSHGLLIMFIVALAFTYIYRAQLFPENITAQIDSYVNKSITWVGLLPIDDYVEQIKDVVVAEDEGVTVAADVNTTEQETDIASTETSTSESIAVNTDETTSEKGSTEQQGITTEQPDVTTEQQVVENNAMPVPRTPNQDSVAMTNSPSAQEHSADHSDDDGAVETDQEAAATSHADLLNNARLAYLNGKPEQAAQLYQELSELNPDDPNVFGEMGNVFYSQGKWKEAGLAYFEAANCLLEQGHPEQVPYLYRVIQGLDQESAEKLRIKMGR